MQRRLLKRCSPSNERGALLPIIAIFSVIALGLLHVLFGLCLGRIVGSSTHYYASVAREYAEAGIARYEVMLSMGEPDTWLGQSQAFGEGFYVVTALSQVEKERTIQSTGHVKVQKRGHIAISLLAKFRQEEPEGPWLLCEWRRLRSTE